MKTAEMPPFDNALELHKVSKSFGGLSVIKDFSCHIRRGSRSAFIGPNGAGKSTLFNLISGAFPMDSGNVKLDGLDITHLPSRKRISHGLARNFQNIRLMPSLTVTENLLLGQQARAKGLGQMLSPLRLRGNSAWHREVHEELRAADLHDYAGSRITELPYGIRKKIEIVRALLARPKLLLLDEPCAGLNTVERQQIIPFLKGLEDRGITLLIVEHDMQFIASLCEHVIALNFGEKIAEGTVEDVRNHPDVISAYLGSEGDEA
ncbi:ABC transporter ATP-binding protein [Bordetella sp. 2513F-2]